jgi:hypothetical protein
LEVLLELSLLDRSAGSLLRVAVASAVEDLIPIVLQEGVVAVRRAHIYYVVRYDVVARLVLSEAAVIVGRGCYITMLG